MGSGTSIPKRKQNCSKVLVSSSRLVALRCRLADFPCADGMITKGGKTGSLGYLKATPHSRIRMRCCPENRRHFKHSHLQLLHKVIPLTCGVILAVTGATDVTANFG